MFVRLQDVDLDERSRQLLFFPGSRRFAGTQAHDHVLPASRLTGAKCYVLDDAISFVEYSKHGDALGHGRYSTLPVRGRGSRPGTRQGPVLLLALAARAKRKRDNQRCDDFLHAYSGIQGS